MELSLFWGFGGEVELFLGIGEQWQKYVYVAEEVFSGIWGDQYIILREQGSKDPPGGLSI